MELDAAVREVLLVEGPSDRAAVLRAAALLGRDLHAQGTLVVSMQGVTNVRRHLAELAGSAVRVGGLCDRHEVGVVARALSSRALPDGTLARPGSAVEPTPEALAEHGFYVCDLDLEDELIRALGVEAVEQVVTEQGDLRSLRSMQQQPAQRDRPADAQLRRFLGSGSGRKVRYAPLLVEALGADRLPAPLRSLLESRSASGAVAT